MPQGPVHAIDSHTAGEPTRVILSGGPNLGTGSMKERLERFRDKHDGFRTAVICEPRGSDILVGAMLCEPTDARCAAGVIFFNNVGYLGMCGHGMIGVVTTLAHLGRISAGDHHFETPVGDVRATLHEDGRVSIRNVPSFRTIKGAEVDVPGLGKFSGDVAWSGNWFYLVQDHGRTLSLENIETLTEVAWKIRQALPVNGVTGDDGAEIDHVELFGPSTSGLADSQSFVLCPGKAYDRSPCGTGTSAKLACLFADGKLKPGDAWRQESIVGTVFEGSVEVNGAGQIIPTITGTAYVTADLKLIFDVCDPFRQGIRS